MKLRNNLMILVFTSILSFTATTRCSRESNDNDALVPTIEKEAIPTNTPTNDIIDEQTLEEEVIDIINKGEIKKVYYVVKETDLTIPDYLSDTNKEEIVTLPKLECLEVYNEDNNISLVKTDNYVGYVDNSDLEELLGTFVVVDISSQELKLYCDNEIVLTTPVVTGKPSTPTDQGLFEIYDITKNRYLVGPNYRSYVDIMMKYNGGEGLHDAEYHTHEGGFKHGWRSLEEFGGETYLTDGSHGCVNMIHNDVMTVRDYVDIGTKVLVKE